MSRMKTGGRSPEQQGALSNATAGVVASVMGATAVLAMAGLPLRVIGTVLGMGGLIAVLLVRELADARHRGR
ncbi:hypothetical protein [Kitasatospora cineracea]|uniref:Uncharacterized protein n=1 Tax=Kitasatospora cineracea TaxID=88074 RepID=A0A8G1XBY7_9ACTN|nr:hypothetical protein [Kitasatospora cineracea]ROR43473.1 hypothetical protein EDD39_1632 [Kitasatospora cineracea]